MEHERRLGLKQENENIFVGGVEKKMAISRWSKKKAKIPLLISQINTAG